MAATRLRAGAEVAEVSGWTDAQLVRAGVGGDRSVFVELYRRHAGVARGVARGGNAAIDQRRRADRASGGRLVGDQSWRPDLDDGSPCGDRRWTGPGPCEVLSASEDSKLVTEAFQALPARWQSVLWLTEVEGVPAREAAGVLGISPNNVAQLAVRARARLRERYLQAHVRNHAPPPCQTTVDQLDAYVAGTLALGRRDRVDVHLAGCQACRDRLAEVEDLGVSLR